MFVETEVRAKHPCNGLSEVRCEAATEPWRRLGWYPTFKLVAEFVLALFMFGVSAPIMAVAALLVKLTSPGPAFYSQVRIGKNGRPFRIYKIRSMYHNCEQH